MKAKEKKKTRKKPFLVALCVVVILGVLGCGALVGINCLMVGTTQDKILTQEQAAQLQDVDCILVLGCLVKDGGKPSDMLSDRLQMGVTLYELGAAPKLLMSGDHGREDYDEVDAMKHFAVDRGIASTDVFMDHAGFSTYESLYRARDVFQAKKIIIVTQQYHLYRALYIAHALGLEAYGVASDYHNYVGQTARDVREVLARVKDFGNAILQPKPTYLGDAIPISGDGNLTNDGKSDFE